MTEPPSPLRMLLSRHTKRREFITLLGGAAAAWPLAARAQQPERFRRIGVLMGYRDGDPEAHAWVVAFEDGLRNHGWAQGRNLHIDKRWATPGDTESIRRCAQELSRFSLNPSFHQTRLLRPRYWNRRALSPLFSR